MNDPKSSGLPAPLVPAGVDLRDDLLPRDAFARMGVEIFSLTYAEARRFVDEVADRMEADRTGSTERRVTKGHRP